MKTRLIATTMSGLLLACACGSPSTIHPVQLAPSDTVRQMAIYTGETSSILLDMPAGPGYNWYYTVSEDWVISMIEPYDYPARSGDLSERPAPGQKEFRVTGLKPGIVVIRFYQMNPALSNGVNNTEVQYILEVR